MMASTGNPNQQQQQQGGGLLGGGGGGSGSGSGPFDMNKFFNPPSPFPSSNPNSPMPTMTPNLTGVGVSTYGPPSPSPSASYPPPAYSYPPHTQIPTPYYHHMPPHHPQPPSPHPQRSLSFPTPPIPTAPPHNPNPNPGARLMALLTTPPPSSLDDHPTPSMHPSPTPIQPILPLQPPISHTSPIRLPSTKLPRGRVLIGHHLSYDVDIRLPGEEHPQLEVTPITKYVSDPALILGHQIAVNNTYICYGLKLGAIRVLNINTALRSLLRGHTQRVTDMAFFAEDVHLLASASIDGRFYVWKISEGSDEEEKPQISGVVVLAIHVTGDEGSIHPRVCWHCHKQEILVIAIGKSVLRIDTTKVGRGVEFVAEEPLECPLDKLIDGIQLVGKHEGEVTDLSMCQWMTTRLVSASKDGTIKIWEDRKTSPLLVLRPHDGQPVDAAKFLPAPHQPGHIVLITAGPLNREVKLWASSGEEGWLLPSDSESWLCTQTLELKSSTEPRNDEAFFNQVVALSQAGLVLLANAKKNAIYAIHLEYGANPAATRMDYLAEFTVTMPILSFTGTTDILPHGEHLVQVYCVQTQAIQQYALDLSQCLPPPIENLGLEKSESSVSHDAAESITVSSGNKSHEASFPAKLSNQISIPESLPELKGPVSSSSDAATLQEMTTTNMDSNAASLLSVSSNADIGSVASIPLPPSPTLSRKPSDFRGEQSINDYSVDRQMDNVQVSSAALASSNDDNRTIQRNASDVNPPMTFKHPTHLITPSEIMATSSGDTPSTTGNVESEAKIQDVVSNDNRNVEVDVKVVGEDGSTNADESTYQGDSHVMKERNEKSSFFSQASDLGADMSRECCALPSESSIMEEARNSIMEALAQPSNSGGEEEDEPNNEVSAKASDFSGTAAVVQTPAPAVKGKKQKAKISQASGLSSPSQSVSSSADLLPGSVTATSEVASSQIQETLNQLLASQKEMQKQISTMVAGPVAKEGKRLEAALGRNMEKAIKANTDALWARIQEENAKHEKLLRERVQQITGLINNFINKDLLGMLERVIKKEMAAVGTNVARTIVPAIEKSISSSISDSFQRGVGDKAVAQLDKSVTTKLEATVARHIQAQFQTSVKQALQDGLKSTLEASIIPAFEVACKAMFEQVDSAFHKGMAEHTASAKHQLESTHSQLALALREALNSASSLAQNLSGELAEGQRKLIALAGANPNTANPLVTQSSNGPLAGLHEKVEQPFDPTKELSRLISEHKYEEAFTAALQRSDVFIVSWLCSQVDLQRLLSIMPLPLSQGVLLSLLQQLACDISKETSRKLAWMTDVATCIVPHDPMIAVHVRPILDQVLQILNHQRSIPTTTPFEQSSIRVLTSVVNSMLMTCK